MLHALKVPEAPSQKIRFEDGQVMDLAAGATACMLRPLCQARTLMVST